MGRVAETADAAQPPRDCGPPKRSAASYAKSLLLPFEPRVEGDGLNPSSLITSMSFFFFLSFSFSVCSNVFRKSLVSFGSSFERIVTTIGQVFFDFSTISFCFCLRRNKGIAKLFRTSFQM